MVWTNHSFLYHFVTFNNLLFMGALLKDQGNWHVFKVSATLNSSSITYISCNHLPTHPKNEIKRGGVILHYYIHLSCLWILSRWYFLNHSMFWNQTWYSDALSWDCMSCRKTGLVFSRSRSQWRLMWSKYDCFYYIFWTIDLLATKLGLVIHHHKPECCERKLA